MADLLGPVASWAKEEPDLCAIADPTGDLTYAELNRQVSAAVGHFRQVGVGAGCHVALHLPNSLAYIVGLLALNRIGAIGVLLSTRVPMISIQAQIGRFNCSHFISDRQDIRIDGCKQIDLSGISFYSGGLGGTDLIDDNRPAVAVMTSGSSGEPKAALLTYRNLYHNALGSNQNIGIGPNDRWLLSLPLFHVGGLGILYRCFIGGGTVVLTDPQTSLGEQIAVRKVTHVSVVNTQFHRLVAERRMRADLVGLKAVLIGGSAVSPDLVSRAVALGVPVHTSYGLTEMGSQVATTSAADRPDRLNTSGRVLPYRQIKLRGTEFLVSGETRFQGYLSESGIKAPFDNDGWFATGDLGSIDTDGYLIVHGRKDNMFVSGGENIQPEFIERVLLGVPDVQEAIVVSVPDAEYGYRPVAFVNRYDGAAIDEELLKGELREQVPGYMVPVRIFPFPTDQVNSSIKPGRKYLADLAGKRLNK